jgi:hypothetical protein
MAHSLREYYFENREDRKAITMKKTLLLFVLLSALHSARASDTLTIRQIYNFDVGDTFDFETRFTTPNFNASVYDRYCIISKTVSTSNDTVTYIRQQIYPNAYTDTIQYYNLDSPVWFAFDTPIAAPYFSIDTFRLNDGRITNKLTYNTNQWPGPGPRYAQYGEGLGMIDTLSKVVYFFSQQTGDLLYSGEYHRTLVYFSKGSEQYGIPYFRHDGSDLVHFTPIPEDCAYWNYTNFRNGSTSQIRTGNKVYTNNHTYVELLYRSFSNNILMGDSALGYFRNDTSGKRVYLAHQPGIDDVVLYDFNQLNAASIGGPTYSSWLLDTFNIAGIRRTERVFNYLDPFGGTATATTIEGIGAEYGLFSHPGYCSQICDPRLTSFCVCGSTIYPYSATGPCRLLTEVEDVSVSQSVIHLYPNPTSDIVHLSFSESNQDHATLILNNLIGQQVYTSTISETETTHDISSLPSSIYTWRIVADNTILKTGKIVKQ